MKEKDYMTPAKVHNSSIAKSKYTEMGKIPDKEFKTLLTDLKEDSSRDE
jgi:hypothetical protein